MARTTRNKEPAAASVGVGAGALVVRCQIGPFQAGDVVDAYADDELIGTAALQVPRGGRLLAADIALHRVTKCPVRLTAMRAHEGLAEALVFPDAESLLRAAGPAPVTARLVGLQPAAAVFAIAADRLPDLPRRMALHAAGVLAGEAISMPGEDGGQLVTFPLAQPPDIGTRLELFESVSGERVLELLLDAATCLAVAQQQIAALHDALATTQQAQLALERRLALLTEHRGQRLLLDRLDLFYLLLSERIERALGPASPPEAVPAPPGVRHFGPGDVDGIGIFDVETDGHQQWRWFGPDATIALRGAARDARRVVLYFHNFGTMAELPLITASIGGPAEPVAARWLETRFAVDIPVERGEPWPGDILIVHLSFDRHHTSAADPRLLAAVFSGAEVISAPA